MQWFFLLDLQSKFQITKLYRTMNAFVVPWFALNNIIHTNVHIPTISDTTKSRIILNLFFRLGPLQYTPLTLQSNSNYYACLQFFLSQIILYRPPPTTTPSHINRCHPISPTICSTKIFAPYSHSPVLPCTLENELDVRNISVIFTYCLLF